MIKQTIKLLALAVLPVLPMAVQAQLNFITNANNTITITGYTGSGGTVIIPDTTNGYPVVSIADSAFYQCTNLTNIYFPGSITKIGVEAFAGCYNLTNTTIPSNVNSIGGGAFAYDWMVIISVDASNSFYSSVDGVLFNKDQTAIIQFPGGKGGTYSIPGSVTNIGDYAFAGCYGLTNITIPNGVTSIGHFAFNFSNVRSISIPNGVTSIGDYAFDYCLSLTNITIPSSVTNIGYAAFALCGRLTGIYFSGNAPSLGDSSVFADDTATVYIVSGKSGWPTPPALFGGLTTAYWTPPPTPPALGISTYGSQPTVFFPTATGTNFVLQMTTNLASGNWVTVSNGVPINGIIITNPPGNAFFRLH